MFNYSNCLQAAEFLSQSKTFIGYCDVMKNKINPVGFGRNNRLIFNLDSRAKRKHRITFDIRNVSF